MAPFHHLHHAALDQIGGGEVLDALAAQIDIALGDLAPFTLEQVGDGAQRGGLAGAIAAQDGDDAALGHLQRDTLEHEDHVVVYDLDAVDVQNDVFGVHCVAFALPIERVGGNASPFNWRLPEGNRFVVSR